VGKGALGTWRFQGGPRTLSRAKPTLEGGTSLWANRRRRGGCVPALKFGRDREGTQMKGQGQNRTGEIPPSGIVGGLAET
jgi:hypothetical protein